ncbi:MAG: alpha/beta hydrolase [Planctomycetaceae bacterium]|nr:alpha/beta hydrolase [Planctomycetaceae bacterium]
MIDNKYPLVLVSGLAADENIFQRQTCAFREVIAISWGEVQPHDTLEDYADKLAASIADQVGDRPCYVAGLSLGGMMAPMIATHFDTKACILIATIRKPSEFPKCYRPWYFFCRYMPRLIAAGHFLVKHVSRCLMPLARRFCPPERVIILRQHCDGKSRLFAQQLRMLFTWALDPKSWRHDFTLDPSERYPFPLYQIHGRRDRVLMCDHTKPDTIIDGSHVLPLFKADEINRFIESVMAETDGV